MASNAPGRLSRGLTMRQLRLLGVGLVVLVVLVAVVTFVVGRLDRNRLQGALGLVPAHSLRVGFTDWALIRSSLGNPAVSTPEEVGRLVDRAYNHDLTSASSINDSAVALQRSFGFSPGNAEWEAYAQSRQGAAMVLKLTSSVDMGAVTKKLGELGYRAPAESDGVWLGGPDTVASIDPSITAELQYVVVLADQHLVISSDTDTYAAVAGRVAEGKEPALGAQGNSSELAGRISDTASAMIWSGAFACQDLSMGKAAAEDQKYAAQLIQQAGGVSPLSGLVMASTPGRQIGVVLGFPDATEAKHDLRPRATLAVGPDVGGAGNFSDNYRMVSAHQTGSDVVLTLQTRPSAAYGLSALDSGPSIFAAC